MYWERESKLSESSRRCLGVFLLLTPDLSLAETELARETPMLSSFSLGLSAVDSSRYIPLYHEPDVGVSFFSMFPKMRSRALL